MKLLNSLFLAVVLYLTVQLLDCPVSAHATSLAKALQERSSSAPGRQLQASTKISSLEKRHNNFITTNEVELTYAEGENLRNEPNYVAGVYVESLVPVLLLEDFEHLADYIMCQPGYIILQVLPDVNRVATEAALLSLAGGGLVITSHYGCNVRGERKLLRIGIVEMNEDDSVFMLHTEHTTWKGSFSSVHIQMYHTNESHAFRPHEDLRRRQGASAASTLVDLPTLTVPVPTATSTASTNQLNLDHALINQALLPANSPIQVTCKNCSTFGTIDFSFANFELLPNLTEISQEGINFSDIFTGGEATVVANGLGAHVELLTNISRSDNFQLPLFQIPLLFAIAISGIGSAGLLYAPTINIGYNLNGSVAFTYGFGLMVPDGSRIVLDLTDPTNSSTSGFSDTKLNTLPFQASVDVDTVLLDVSLRHQVQIAFQFNELDVGADVGIYLDLPKLKANISHVSNVDENCTALSTSQSKDKAIAQKVLTDVYLIKSLVDWQIGVDGEAYIAVSQASFDVSLDNGTITNIPSSCLNFDRKSGMYIPAAEVVEQAEKNAAAGQLRISRMTYRTAFISGLVALLLSDLFGLG